MRRPALIALVLAATELVAAAQPSRAPAPAPAPVRRKNPVIAAVLPLGVTIASLAVLPLVDEREFEASGTEKTALQALGWTAVAGLLVGPGLGSLYVGDVWNVGLKTRLVGLGVIGAGALIFQIGEPGNSAPSTMELGGSLVMLGGVVTYVVGAAIEVVKASRTASARNRTISIAPARADIGASLVGRF